MSQAIHLELEVPDDLARLRLPAGVQQRLTELLDKQDTGTTLTDAERKKKKKKKKTPTCGARWSRGRQTAASIVAWLRRVKEATFHIDHVVP